MEKVDFSVGEHRADNAIGEEMLSRRNFGIGIAGTVAGLFVTPSLSADESPAKAPEKETGKPKEAEKPLRDITDDTFDEEVLKSQEPILLVFHTDWCGACLGMIPVLKELQKEFEKQTIILRMDIDDNTTDKRFRGKEKGRTIPYCLYFTYGEATDSSTGAEKKEIIRLRLERLIARHEKTKKKKAPKP